MFSIALTSIGLYATKCMSVVLMSAKNYKTVYFWLSVCSQHVTVLFELTTGPGHLFNIASSNAVVPEWIPRAPDIRDQFLRDPWIHFCNPYFEVYLFLNKK
jgi:hypothetical protein